MNSLISFFSAEEFQKLGFPASEFVLEGLLNPSDAEVWVIEEKGNGLRPNQSDCRISNLDQSEGRIWPT